MTIYNRKVYNFLKFIHILLITPIKLMICNFICIPLFLTYTAAPSERESQMLIYVLDTDIHVAMILYTI